MWHSQPPKSGTRDHSPGEKWCPDSGRQNETISFVSFNSSAQKVGAIRGPGFGLLGNSGEDHRHMSEAAATWQWNNFLEGQAALGQVVVHINLDETSVKLCPCVPRGAVAIDGGSTRKEALEQEQKASLHARRSAMTFICCVCDDTIVQRALPQVIIGNERVLPLSAADILNNKYTDNIFVLRQKSSWVNQDTMVRIIQLLGACLMAFQNTHFFILSMDACPCDCTSEVAKTWAKAVVLFLGLSIGNYLYNQQILDASQCAWMVIWHGKEVDSV